jgi:seryl-tRNA(Sec) selenium transferase
VRIRPVRGSTASFERRLRNGATPVVARIEEGAVLIDLRTVDPAEDATLCNLIRIAMGSAPTP